MLVSELFKLADKYSAYNIVVDASHTSGAYMLLRHFEGVTREAVPESIIRTMERLSTTGRKVSSDTKDVMHVHSEGNRTFGVRKVGDKVWQVQLCLEPIVVPVEELGFSDVHLNVIHAIENIPYGIRMICSPDVHQRKRVMHALMKEVSERFNNGIIVKIVKDTSICYEDFEEFNNIVFIEAGDEFPVESISALSPDAVFVDLNSESMLLELTNLSSKGVQVWCFSDMNSVDSALNLFSLAGVPKFMMDTKNVSGIVAFRSVPKLCEHCAIDYHAVHEKAVSKEDERLLNILDRVHTVLPQVADRMSIRFHNPEGCEYCGHDGYQGDVIVAEALLPDPILLQGKREDNLVRVSGQLNKQNFKTMLNHGIYLISKGMVDPKDVERIVGLLTLDKILNDLLIDLEEELANV